MGYKAVQRKKRRHIFQQETAIGNTRCFRARRTFVIYAQAAVKHCSQCVRLQQTHTCLASRTAHLQPGIIHAGAINPNLQE